MSASSKEKTTILVLPSELFLIIAEECVGYGWFAHFPDRFGPRHILAPTFKRTLANLGLVCKDFRKKTIEIQLRHIQIKSPVTIGWPQHGGVVHDYHRTTYESKSGYFDKAEKNIRAMLDPCSPIISSSLSETIQAITLELPTPDYNKDNFPTGGLVDGLYHLLKSVKKLKVVRLHLAAQKSRPFRRRFDKIRKKLGDDANFSHTIETLALGRHCQFIIPFCPGVKHISGYGNEWMLNGFIPGTVGYGNFNSAVDKLIKTAGTVVGLESFELMAYWNRALLDRIENEPNLLKLKALKMVGRLEGQGPGTNLVYIDSDENKFLRQLCKFPYLETIVLPGHVPTGLFRHSAPVESEADTSQDFHGLTLYSDLDDPGNWVQPGEAPMLPRTDFFPPMLRERFWDCDDGIYKPSPYDRLLNAYFDEAYTHLAKKLGQICPKLQTLWIDRLHDGGQTFTQSEGLTYECQTMTRDVRIKFNRVQCDSMMEVDSESIVIDRTLLRKRATDGDTKVYGYDSIR